MSPPNTSSQDERLSISSGMSRQTHQSSPNLVRPTRQVPSSHANETATATATTTATAFVVTREHQYRTIVSCKAETVLISSAGDVLVCRDRETPYPRVVSGKNAWSDYNWHQDLLGACCDAECDDLSASVQHAAQCSPFCNDSSNGNGNNKNGSTFSTSKHEPVFRTGLMGGAEVASPWHDDGLRGGAGFYADHQAENDATFANEQYYHQSPPFNTNNNNNNNNANLEDTEDDSGFGDIAIVPIRSFDYSHFGEGGNDMIPERSLQPVSELTPQNNTSPRNYYNNSNNKTGNSPHGATESAASEHFMQGVPTFVPDFSQVRVTQVSAHPLGSHVLLISDAGLLYSYGMNDCGQLGIGMRTPILGTNRGYIMAPTIVTPLIENGGKAIACAAGVNHSLVVVMTEEQRLVKSRSFEHGTTTRRKADVSGGNVSPSTESIVYHQMYGFGRNDYMKIGLVSSTIPEAGINEGTACVALPHRVALRCKIKADGNRSFQPQGIFDIAASVDHSAALVRRASGDVELYTWGNASHGALGLPHPIVGLDLRNDENSEVQAVPVPSLVAAISCSSNPAARSVSLLLDDEGEYPVGLSLGQRCSFVVTSIGRCFSFGTSEEGMLGLGDGITEAQKPTEISFPEESRSEKVVSVSAGASHVVALTRSGNTFAWGHKEFAGLVSSLRNSSADESMHTACSPERLELQEQQQGSNGPTCIVQACAGYDNSIIVADTGRVYSCGRNSGRLGLGELTADVVGIPKPLFGGLRLWQQRQQEPPVRRKPPPTLKRGLTLG